MIYDDGTELIDAKDGSQYAFNQDGVFMSGVSSEGRYFFNDTYSQDAQEAAKFSQFYPKTNTAGQNVEWWQQAAVLGLTRAVDLAFGPKAPDKSTAAATYAGANGQTRTTGRQAPAPIGNDTLFLVVIAGAALFAFS